MFSHFLVERHHCLDTRRLTLAVMKTVPDPLTFYPYNFVCTCNLHEYNGMLWAIPTGLRECR